ncbi:MAG: carboxypeptidase regulatory-like domain-containing protein [Bacteroidetes bacterium]|nr:carboxypeptidase regulatory-like domain-containing protein [Bacteroidota bacterium]
MNRLYSIIILCILLLPITVFFNSCKKDKSSIIINGSVYDPNIKIYIADASVTISTSKVSSGFYNSNYSDIASTTTDANGNFTFKFDKELSNGYRIFISKNKYFDLTVDISGNDFQAGNTYTPVYEIFPVGYLKLHVKNNTPFDDNDFIAYSYTFGFLSCYECCSNIVNKAYGENYDVTTKCKTYGSQNVVIGWHVTKHGNDIAYNDTVFCSPFDTTYYEILY